MVVTNQAHRDDAECPRGAPPARSGPCALHRRCRARRNYSVAGPQHLKEITMRVATGQPLNSGELARLDAYWRAANYLSVGQIYLMDNPLLREPLRPEHVKPRLLGHWGTTPGLNLLYAHLNRIIAARGRDVHLHHRPRPRRSRPGGQRLAGGHATARCTRRSARTRRAWAGCSASSPSPAECPATSRRRRPARSTRAASWATRLAHAYGAAFDNPDLVVGVRDRRRRGRDRAAGRRLALQQVPRPGRRRRGAADPAPQRVQDRQPDRAGPRSATTS